MARNQYNKIQIRRGRKADLPDLAEGEPGFCTDTKEVYIGGGGSNTKIVTKPEMDTAVSSAIQAAPLQPNPLFTVTLPSTGWTASGTSYTRTISNSAIVANAKLNIAPGNDNTISQLSNDGVTSMRVKNSNGTATVILENGKPSVNVTVQIEVVPEKGISGGTVYGTPVSVSGGFGYVASSSAPANKKMLWIDTGNSGVTKYYNGSSWMACSAVYA